MIYLSIEGRLELMIYLFFISSGHGYIYKKKHVLRLNNLSNNTSNLHTDNIIDDYISEINGKYKILILDCCFAQPTTWNNEKYKPFLILSASDKKQTTIEDDHLRASPFSYFISELLSNTEWSKYNFVTIGELFQKLKDILYQRKVSNPNINLPNLFGNSKYHEILITPKFKKSYNP